MKIAIVGTGYVGLVTGTCFSEMGNDVICVDVDENKVENLKKGILPIYEPGLEELVKKNYEADRLHFTSDLSSCVNSVEVIFSAVGTPPDEDGSADLQYVLDVARTIGKYMNKYILLVTKSTVPIGTALLVKEVIKEELSNRNINIDFDVASNPEFLKEGNAIEDFMKPDRVVIGVESKKSEDILSKLYKPMLINNFRVIFMDIASAEMTKYAANSMLATRISFMNDIANLCEIMGADIDMVRRGIGSDSRIGNKFLYAGCGYGGSCFPKDIKALLNISKRKGYSMRVLEAVEEVNEFQKNILFDKYFKHFKGDTKGKRVAVWGLSFKPETDDMREAPSLTLINKLLENDCEIIAYDPIAMNECRKKIGDSITYAENIYDTVIDANVIFHVTEWKEFRMPKWDKIKKLMKPNPILIDGRNVYSSADLDGITYYAIGKRS